MSGLFIKKLICLFETELQHVIKKLNNHLNPPTSSVFEIFPKKVRVQIFSIKRERLVK